MKRIAIQGVKGCFHEQAARLFYEEHENVVPEIVECDTFDDLYISMSKGEADAAVMAIENTQQYNGLYHVLGGVISPMDGVGPNDLEIDSLIKRVEDEEINEVIMALSSTMEGDTTNFYISRKLAPLDVKQTVIARGISVGDELEYTDEVTLGRSILNRTIIGER